MELEMGVGHEWSATTPVGLTLLWVPFFFLSENIDHIPQYDRTFTDPHHSDHSDRSAE